MLRPIFAATLCVLLQTAAAPGYGPAGHQAIGKIAEKDLEGTRAGREVRKLLLPDERLDYAANWADRAKLPEKYLSDEMKSFIAANPKHHSYHYCDVPFQVEEYRDGITGTNDRDIVHILRICIGVLQSPEEAPENPLHIGKRTALLLIAHLIGDLHQPLHVGCSYVDADNHFVNPETGAKGQDDAGANYYRLGGRINLHGYWDTITVKAARDHAGEEDFTTWLVAKHPPQPAWDATGPAATWPTQWASESVRLARRCFDGIELGERTLIPADEKFPEHFQWKIALPEDYAVRSRDIVEEELSKGGYRLAALLKAIWPEEK